jgi:hypothetical protein
LLRLFSQGNYSHPGKASSGKQGSIGTGSYRNIPDEAEICGTAKHAVRDIRQRPKKRFHTGKIEHSSVAGRIFHSGRKRLCTVEQGGMRAGLL